VADSRVLVVDDEPRYRKLIRYNLESVGYEVSCAANGEDALDAVVMDQPSLVVLDIKLPGIDGIAVCKRVRDFSTVPVIMLTALGTEDDKVRGFAAGADDYLTKPFSAKELLARVDAVLRRAGMSSLPFIESGLQCGTLAIDFAARRVRVGGEEVRLTSTEYRLLHGLATNCGKVMTQEELVRLVWGSDYSGQYDGLRMYILRLRRKIEPDPSRPALIVTRPGIGYMFVTDADDAASPPGRSSRS